MLIEKKSRFLYRWHVAKTRADHTCASCGKIIPKGCAACYRRVSAGREFVHTSLDTCEVVKALEERKNEA